MVLKKTTVRVNSRVTPEQFEFIKKHAKKLKISEGEALRQIIQAFVDKNK